MKTILIKIAIVFAIATGAVLLGAVGIYAAEIET